VDHILLVVTDHSDCESVRYVRQSGLANAPLPRTLEGVKGYRVFSRLREIVNLRAMVV
jgi:hypothetical protein